MKRRFPQLFRLAALVTIAVFAAPVMASAQGRTFLNPLTGKAQSLALSDIVGRVVQAILGISGVVAAVVIMISGARILFAQGNDETISKGKQALLWAVLGLAVAFGGYIIVDLLLSQSSAFFGG